VRDRIFVRDLARLAEIPLAKHGSLKSLVSTRRAARRSTPSSRWIEAVKNQTRRQLLRAGVARRYLAKADSNQFVRILLEGCGIPDGRVTFRDTLDRIGAFSRLSADAQSSLKPWFKFHLDSLRLACVYSMIVLAAIEKETLLHDYQDIP
jgi:hypothetical protein